jgi:hypothetical protein
MNDAGMYKLKNLTWRPNEKEIVVMKEFLWYLKREHVKTLKFATKISEVKKLSSHNEKAHYS